MENKRPAFQFYPQDFLSDPNVMALTNEQVGIYIKLICFCWMQGSIPSDIQRLAKMCNMNNLPDEERCQHIEKLLEPIILCFRKSSISDSQLIHPRLEKEIQKQDDYREKCSEGGKKSQKIQRETRLLAKAAASTLKAPSNSSSSTSSLKTKTLTLSNSDFEILKSNFEKDLIRQPNDTDSERKAHLNHYKKTVGLDPKKRAEFQKINDSVGASENKIEKVQPPPGVPNSQIQNWTQCKREIEGQIQPDNFSLLFDRVAFAGIKNHKAKLICGNKFHVDCMEDNYTDLIETTLSKIFQYPVQIEYVTKEQIALE